MISKIKILACVFIGLAANLANGSQADKDTIFLPGRKSITLSVGDITEKMGARGVKTAIVSAANKYMDYVGAGGVAGAIGQLAGRADLQRQARAQGEARGAGRRGIFCEPGQALITETSLLADTSFKDQHITAIIHAVGPDCRIDQENNNRGALLTSVYASIFDAAEAHGVQKLYIPGISIAIFACPIDQATQIAFQVAVERLRASRSLKAIEFVLFDQATQDVYLSYLALAREKLNLSIWDRARVFLGL